MRMVISSTEAPGWCWRSKAAVLVFAQVVRAQETKAMRLRTKTSCMRRSEEERATPGT
jgi:hypothetical protein